MKLKYILFLVTTIILIIVAVTIGADNDQLISFNYIFAKNELQLSTLVALLFGLGLILGWLITGVFYLRLRIQLAVLRRQVKQQTKEIESLKLTNNNRVIK